MSPVDEVENAVSIAAINAQLAAMNTTLGEIKTQTTLTNGRVNSLEGWRNRAIGAWFVVSLFGPIVTGLVVGLVLAKA